MQTDRLNNITRYCTCWFNNYHYLSLHFLGLCNVLTFLSIFVHVCVCVIVRVCVSVHACVRSWSQPWWWCFVIDVICCLLSSSPLSTLCLPVFDWGRVCGVCVGAGVRGGHCAGMFPGHTEIGQIVPLVSSCNISAVNDRLLLTVVLCFTYRT